MDVVASFPSGQKLMMYIPLNRVTIIFSLNDGEGRMRGGNEREEDRGEGSRRLMECSEDGAKKEEGKKRANEV